MKSKQPQPSGPAKFLGIEIGGTKLQIVAARPGDIALTMSVSGNSPNGVKAIPWARDHGLVTIAMVGQKRGKLAGIAEHVLTVDDGHYGRAEDAHMTMSCIICYAFMEKASAL